MCGMDEQLERRRVAAYVLQDAPLPTLRERWQRAEDLGFDAIYLADHTGTTGTWTGTGSRPGRRSRLWQASLRGLASAPL